MPFDKNLPLEPEKMFHNYMFRCGMNINEMKGSVQYIEMKKSYYAALSNILLIICSDVDTKELDKVITNISDKVITFWDIKT